MKMAKEEKNNRKVGSVDFMLLVIIVILLLFGLIMLFSASSPRALDSDAGIYSIIAKQSAISVLGCIGMFITANFNYHRYKKLSRLLMAGTLVIMYIVPIIGFASHGATRQISIGSISFQPSEIAKFILAIYFAAQFSNKKTGDLRNPKNVGKAMIVLALYVGACVFQRHMSAAVVLAGITIMIMIVAGLPMIYMYIVGGASVVLFSIIALSASYRLDRIRALIDPFAYSRGIGWQIIQSLYAVGSGGLFGLGLGQSRQKYHYLPEAHNDYIFAVVCEELGFLGAITVILLFVIFVWRGMSIALKARDKFGCILAFGITAIIGVQMLINIGVVLSVLPSTGMQLPFFSSGGTSMIVMLTGVGILLNISRSSKIKKL